MPGINPVNLLIRQSSPFFKQKNTNKIYTQNSSNYPRLRPLAFDTISFGSSERLNKSLMDAFDNKKECEEVHSNAGIAKDGLYNLLKKAMDPHYYNQDKNPTGIVQEILTRIKSPESIREKTASKLAWAIKHDTTKTFNPEEISAIKSNCGDIIGGRIILRSPTQEKTSKIIDSLIQEVKAHNLKIKRIENYFPEGDNRELEYFKQEDLERLRDAVNQEMKTNIQIIPNEKSSGYMAVHLDVDLSNSNYRSKNDGYTGEIQIVGYDVSKLKDIEDLCYKLKSDKEIKNGHPAYRVFSEYFKKYVNSENIKNDFEIYTKVAYMMQRLKEPSNKRQYGKKEYLFPSQDDCVTLIRNRKDIPIEEKNRIIEAIYRVPDELDFNKLSKLKSLCDEIYELTRDL